MAVKFLDKTGLGYFWGKIKAWCNATFAAITHSHAWSTITGKPTTISGYGITDAKIANGTITLGSNSITPLISHQDISGKVNKSGDTLTGNLTTKRTNITRGSSTTYVETWTHLVTDSANNRVGMISTEYKADKSSFNGIWAYNTTIASGSSIGSLGIGCDTSGNIYTNAPTPATSDNSTKIATTAFVKAQGYLTSVSGTAGTSLLAWNTENTVYTVGGHAIKVKLPANPNTNTTYTIATGDANGQIKVTPNSGSAYNVNIKGLGTAAYTDSTNYVHTTGNEEIGGNKVFTSNFDLISAGPRIVLQSKNLTKGTNPSDTAYNGISFTCKYDTGMTANSIGFVESYVTSEGNTCTQLAVFPYINGSSLWYGLGIRYDKANSLAYTYAPHPPANDSSSKIATTQWVNTYYLPLTGGSVTGDITLKDTRITRGTAPSSTFERVLWFRDSSNIKMSALSSIYYTDKSTLNALYAYNTTISDGPNIGRIGIGCNSSGNVYTIAPTPAANDNSTQIATTAYVKNQGYAIDSAVVHNSGNETVSGIKTFNNRIHGTIEAPIHVTASTTSSSAICNTVVAVCDDTPQWISELYYCREASTNGTTVLRTWSKDHSAATFMSVYYDETNKVGYLNFDNLYKDIRVANANFRRGGTRSSTAWWSYCFTGNNSSSDMGGIWQFVDTSGQSEVQIRTAFDTATYSYKNYWLWTKRDGTSAAGLSADIFRPTMGTAIPLGGAGAARWGQVYSTNSTISTSDEREKCDIELIPDDILDAWESCEFYQYKMKDSVDKKGENARYHTGMIAQRLDTKFKNVNKNLNKYGLFCYDEWEASEARRDDHGKITEPAVEAGNEYSIRYEEALCMEAAYQRRKNKILENRISELETQVQNMLQILESLKGA